MKFKKTDLTIAILIPVLTGGISGLLTKNAMSDFKMLNKPPFALPAWLFPILWFLLYVLMGIASYLVARKGMEKVSVQRALKTYSFQLALNVIWPFLFFWKQNYWFAFLWIIALWIAIFITVLKFEKLDRRAALLMLPYLIYVAYAGYLNLGIFFLN